MFIYIITNLQNAKKYIGQHSGSDLEKYLRQNIYRAVNGGNEKRALYAAIRKYGRENFQIRPLVIVGTIEDLNYYEKAAICSFNTKSPNGYNLTDGGEGLLNPSIETRKILSGIFKGRIFSTETRRKMSETRKAHLKVSPRVITPELCQNISKALKGRKLSAAHAQKIRERETGKIRSIETRAKISLSLIGNQRTKGHVLSEEHKQKMSRALKGHLTSDETKQKISNAQKGKPRFSSHLRWHVNRNIPNPNCIFCSEATNVVEHQSRLSGNEEQPNSLQSQS